MALTLEQLKAKLPAEWSTLVDQYGPAFVAMSTEEVTRWINLALAGDPAEAYALVLKRLDNDSLLSQWAEVSGQWQAANLENARRMAWERELFHGVMKALAGMALAAVGL